MRVTFALAVGAAWAMLAVGPAMAGQNGGHRVLRHAGERLPPISGTIHLDHRAFGSGRPEGLLDGLGRREDAGLGEDRMNDASFRVAPGYQGNAYRQLAEGGYPAGPRPHRRLYAARRAAPMPRLIYGTGFAVHQQRYRKLADVQAYDGRGLQAAHRPWWQGDGSGLVGLVGDEGAGSGGIVTTGWGTADSASGGGGYPLPSARYQAEAAIPVGYGESGFWSGSSVPPTGGLGYYNSGSPGRMAYYGSSSSAGPYGSPGGLGIYSSGAYGPGPHIIHIPRHRAGRDLADAGCRCGPHIIHVGRDSRRDAAW